MNALIELLRPCYALRMRFLGIAIPIAVFHTRTQRFMNPSRLFLPVLLLVSCPSAWAQSPAVRQSNEDVNDATVRGRPGLRPDAHLLFNGWGITPAGTPVPISDLALKLVIAPDKKTVVAVSGGFCNPGLTLLDISGRRVRHAQYQFDRYIPGGNRRTSHERKDLCLQRRKS